eukprot:2037859-Rhodomonas_salina.1
MKRKRRRRRQAQEQGQREGERQKSRPSRRRRGERKAGKRSWSRRAEEDSECAAQWRGARWPCRLDEEAEQPKKVEKGSKSMRGKRAKGACCRGGQEPEEQGRGGRRVCC